MLLVRSRTVPVTGYNSRPMAHIQSLAIKIPGPSLESWGLYQPSYAEYLRSLALSSSFSALLAWGSLLRINTGIWRLTRFLEMPFSGLGNRVLFGAHITSHAVIATSCHRGETCGSCRFLTSRCPHQQTYRYRHTW